MLLFPGCKTGLVSPSAPGFTQGNGQNSYFSRTHQTQPGLIRKFLILLVLYLGACFTLSVAQSCGGFLTYKATICDISFATEKNHFTDVQPDTLTGEIIFVISASPDRSTCSRSWPSTLLPNCYATTKCAVWQNELIRSSFTLSLNRKIMIDSLMFSPGTDLLRLPSFASGVDIRKNENDCKSIRYTIQLMPSLISRVTFDPGIHTVSFSCRTSDNRTFNKERQVIFVL